MSSCTPSGLERRKELSIDEYPQHLALQNINSLLVIFNEVIPEKPLNKTVWDNVTGAFWDINESKKIGFTQNYSKFITVAATVGAIGGAVGEAAVGMIAGPKLVDTRIIIPFGNVFTKTFENAISKNIKNYKICFDFSCEAQSSLKNSLSIKIDKFHVWEEPLNHLNFYVKGNSLFKVNGKVEKEYSFEKTMLSQKLGTILSTHNSFLQEMNKLINLFTQELTTEIILNTIK